MVKALPLLPDPFFCINSDNIWLDGPEGRVPRLVRRVGRQSAWMRCWRWCRIAGRTIFAARAISTWTRLGRVTRRRSGRIAPFIFTGIQLVSHRLLRDAPQGPFSTNVLWDRAIEQGRLFGIAFTGQWFEVGTPEAIPATEAALREG